MISRQEGTSNIFADVSAARRRNMAAIRGKDTKPEMSVRRAIFGLGYRYRLHVSNLPGTPDIVFSRRRKIIEIRGCFWHRHPACPLAARPRTRTKFWKAKFDATVWRDSHNLALLQKSGWAVLVIWECETRDPRLVRRLRTFLGSAFKK